MKLAILCIVTVVLSSQVFAARPEPQAQIDTFFGTLRNNGPTTAFDELCKNTLLEAQKKSELAAGAPQIEAVLKIYGNIVRVENVEKKSFGESSARFRLISYHSSGAPLFWEFMFFKTKSEWQIYVFRYNDQFYRAFSDTP